MNCLVCQTPTQDKQGHQWCPECNLIKLNNGLVHDLDEYTKYYSALYGTDLETRINVNRVAKVMKFVETGKRVLDFGCSCGNFLARLEMYDYDCVGYEPSKTAPGVKTCADPIYTDIDQLRGRFDCITMFDVIEHFDNPRPTLTYVISLLNAGGKLLVMTPSPHNFMNDLSKFYHLKPGEHAYMWSLDSLTRIMNEMGMERIYYDYDEGGMRKNSGNGDDLLTAIFQKK